MENRKGQGIFLGVVSVATLVVAIIGATFAFFSASATGGSGTVQGQTLGGSGGGVLTLSVNKITWTGTTAASPDLVPSDITTGTAQNAITAKCEAVTGVTGDNSGTKYTGCHLYRIVAEAGSDLPAAVLTLDSFTLSGVTDSSKWNYAMWDTTDPKTENATYTLGTNIGAATGTGTLASAATVYSGGITASSPKVFYMLVYVENTNDQQNAYTTVEQTETPDSNNVVGSYTGTFSLETTGGDKVQATFTAG